jgi:hypothetical protein
MAHVRAEKVFWSPEEYARFYAAAKFFGPPKRGDSLQVYEATQRRAQVPIRPFDPATIAKMNRVRAEPTKAPEPTPEPAATPVAEPPAEPKIEPAAAIEEVELPPPPTVVDLVAGAILELLYHPQIRRGLRDLVAEALAPEAELEQRQAITWREPKPGERRLRVVVAGGNFQAHNIAAVPGLDLRIWGQMPDESTHRLKALLQSCDVAIAVTSGVRHGAMYMIKDRAKQGKLKAIYWTRPLSELRPELVRLAQNGAAP